MADAVLLDRDGPVAILTLNRPDQMNAWSPEVEDSYYEHLDALEADPEVRAVVLTGSGRAFCAGVGFGDLGDLGSGASAAAIDRPRPRSRPYFFPKPLIAALNGATAGLGLVEALYCDFRFCVGGAKLTTSFPRRGLIAEYGVAWLLPRLIGSSRARDLLISGRVVLGEEAAEIGLVDRLAADDELVPAAVDYAREICDNCSPSSIAVIKAQLHRAAESSFDAAFEEAEGRLRQSLERPDFVEGVNSFLERRSPSFSPLDADLPR